MTACFFGGWLDAASTAQELAARSPELHALACHAACADPSARPDENASLAQAMLVGASLVGWVRARARARASVLIGQESGELAALAAAGALSWVDAVWLAAVRGHLMSSMIAELGLAALALREVGLGAARHLARSHELVIASDNAPGEVVLAGAHVFVSAAEFTARGLGFETRSVPVARVVPSAPLAVARREWRAALDVVEMRPAKLPVFSCTTASLVTCPRAVLVQGLTATVRLRWTLAVLARLGEHQLVSIASASAGIGNGRLAATS
jgi:[acyl-carrier-protein] S-malonyltransferase